MESVNLIKNKINRLNIYDKNLSSTWRPLGEQTRSVFLKGAGAAEICRHMRAKWTYYRKCKHKQGHN